MSEESARGQAALLCAEAIDGHERYTGHRPKVVVITRQVLNALWPAWKGLAEDGTDLFPNNRFLGCPLAVDGLANGFHAVTYAQI